MDTELWRILWRDLDIGFREFVKESGENAEVFV